MGYTNTKVRTIYLDMDGVIADFNLYWQNHFHQPTVRGDPNVEEHWNLAVNEQHCFEKLEMCHGSKLLIRHLRHIPAELEILSSTSNRSNADLVAKQKRNWLDNHGLADIKSNFVRTKPDKANFATPTSLLIDDSRGCIDPFVKKGGMGILHNNAMDTILQLSKLLKG